MNCCYVYIEFAISVLVHQLTLRISHFENRENDIIMPCAMETRAAH
jgi:hypothetical protein